MHVELKVFVRWGNFFIVVSGHCWTQKGRSDGKERVNEPKKTIMN